MRLSAAFVESQRPEQQALFLAFYDAQAHELRRSLRHLSSAGSVTGIVMLRGFVTTAQAIGDPRGLLAYFLPLLEFLELQQTDLKDWHRLRRAAQAMADAAEAAGLSKRQVGRLRRYAAALDLVGQSERCIKAMERVEGEISAKLDGYEEMTAAERRALERDVQRLDQHMREERQRSLDVRRTLLAPRMLRPMRALRPRCSRRPQRRAVARRAQSDSGGDDGDGDGGSDPPPLDASSQPSDHLAGRSGRVRATRWSALCRFEPNAADCVGAAVPGERGAA